MWSAVCQSCVITTCLNCLAMRLMSGTMTSPSFTASEPPGVKQFCTSTTTNTSRLPILRVGAAQALDPSNPKPAAANRKFLRFMVTSVAKESVLQG